MAKLTAVMAQPSPEELLEAFKNMTLLELAAFMRQFREAFGL